MQLYGGFKVHTAMHIVLHTRLFSNHRGWWEGGGGTKERGQEGTVVCSLIPSPFKKGLSGTVVFIVCICTGGIKDLHACLLSL